MYARLCKRAFFSAIFDNHGNNNRSFGSFIFCSLFAAVFSSRIEGEYCRQGKMFVVDVSVA